MGGYDGVDGHAVLAVPVPELDDFVRARTAHYDSTYLSTDPAFVHAHVTVLSPWLADPSPDDLALVARIAASVEPFDHVLHEPVTFPNGLIHLRPDPAGPFQRLMDLAAAAFPQCPPYAGEFADVRPHLTLDHTAGGVDEASVRTMLGDAVPVTARADRLDLQWWAAGGCRLLDSWKLGS